MSSTESVTACMANIGPKERQKRMISGAVGLAIFLVGAGACMLGVESRWWRIFLALPMLVAALGYFQAREQTCVRLAATGSQNLDNGEKEVRDVDFLSRTLEQAQRVWAKSILATILVMVALLVLPTL